MSCVAYICNAEEFDVAITIALPLRKQSRAGELKGSDNSANARLSLVM
jgi:hypothetical protein